MKGNFNVVQLTIILNDAVETSVGFKTVLLFLTKDLRRLLFEMDGDTFTELSNFSGSFNEYNDGKYYVLIKQKDLDEMNFQNTVTIYQFT